jgi:hypothetical protein
MKKQMAETEYVLACPHCGLTARGLRIYRCNHPNCRMRGCYRAAWFRSEGCWQVEEYAQIPRAR